MKHRLSKLQKWILARTYAIGTLSNRDIWEKYYGIKWIKDNTAIWGFHLEGREIGIQNPPSARGVNRAKSVILNRSKELLERQGLIRREWTEGICRHERYPIIVLTDAGRKKAKELICTESIDDL